MEKFKTYWGKNSWKWKNLLNLILFYLIGILFFLAVWGACMSFAAWLTMHAWSIIVVGIFGFGREITFWESFVFYAALAFIARLFRSETKVTQKR